ELVDSPHFFRVDREYAVARLCVFSQSIACAQGLCRYLMLLDSAFPPSFSFWIAGVCAAMPCSDVLLDRDPPSLNSLVLSNAKGFAGAGRKRWCMPSAEENCVLQ